MVVKKMEGECTIVLQGIFSPEVDIVKTLTHYLDYGSIIVSTYFDLYPEKIRVLQTQFPTVRWVDNSQSQLMKDLQDIGQFSSSDETHEQPYYNNGYYQIRTTLNGLKEVQTEWVLKTRCDHFYSHLDKMVEAAKKQPEKITCSSLFTSGETYPCRYIVSDSLFTGSTKRLIDIFSLAQDQFRAHTPPETNIWRPYFLQQSGQPTLLHLQHLPYSLYIKLASRLFSIYSVNQCMPYRLHFRWSSEIIKKPLDLYPLSTTTAEYLRGGVYPFST